MALEYDRFMRELNLKGWAQKRAARLKAESPTDYAMIDKFAQGINDRVAMMPILPLQFHLTGVKWENFTVDHLFYMEMLFYRYGNVGR